MRRHSVLMRHCVQAMGGASGGYTAASKEIVELLRQRYVQSQPRMCVSGWPVTAGRPLRARPYLFSNSIPPPVVGASQAAFEVRASARRLACNCYHSLTRAHRC
jgi:glycine C-acetyltransferase